MSSGSDQPGRKELDHLLELSGQVKCMPVENYPDLEKMRDAFLQKIQGAIRDVYHRIVTPDRRREVVEEYDRALAAYERWGVFDGEAEKGALMSPKEVRNAAPSKQHVLEVLEARPELFSKVAQGFTRVLPVPIGLSPVYLREPMAKAMRHYQSTQQLRLNNPFQDISLKRLSRLRENEPVRMDDRYAAADSADSLVYFPQRFTKDDHGGMTKAQLLESMPHAGWQVLLVENIPSSRALRYMPEIRFVPGRGNCIAGRARPERLLPHQYLDLLHSDDQYAHEQGFTLEAWQSLFLSHLTETEGEVIDDDYTYDIRCTCLGAYFPSSDDIPSVRWETAYGGVIMDVKNRRHPRYPHPLQNDKPRFAVKIL